MENVQDIVSLAGGAPPAAKALLAAAVTLACICSSSLCELSAIFWACWTSWSFAANEILAAVNFAFACVAAFCAVKEACSATCFAVTRLCMSL